MRKSIIPGAALRAALLATLSIFSIFSTFATLTAHAGLVMVQSMGKADGSVPPTTNTIYVEKECVRIENGAHADQYFIYRGDKQVFWMINTKDKSYMEMTQKDMEDNASKMNDTMKKMHEQLDKMPPEQRKKMEEMMGNMMSGGAKPVPTLYKKIGSGEKIGKWVCDKYEGDRDGIKHSDMWTLDPKKLSIGENDMQVLKDMAKFFEKSAKGMEGMFGDPGKNGLEGIPVKTVTYDGATPKFQTEIQDVRKESVAASLFELPAGLAKKSMGMGAKGKAPEAK